MKAARTTRRKGARECEAMLTHEQLVGIAVCAGALCAGLFVLGISITWTGYGGDHQWTNRINWSPDQVPTLNDDVTIESGNVEVTIATGANSITMGTSFSKSANLTLFNKFYLGGGGLNVEGNGNVMINSGAAEVTGPVTIGGAVYFQSGMIGGTWTVTTRGIADLSGPAQKALSGCSLSVAGALVLSGVLALNQSSSVAVTSTATLSGAVSIQAQDGTQVLFDTSAGNLTYTGGGTFQIQAPMKLGAFLFEGGNITIYNDIAFRAPLLVPNGSYVASVGTAAVQLVSLSGGGVVSGAGSSMTIGASTFGGVLNAVAGNMTLSAGGKISTVTVAGGQLVAGGTVTASTLTLLAGSLSGPVRVSQAYLKSPGFGLNGALTVDGQLLTSGTSVLAFGSGGALYVGPSATLKVGGPLTLTGSSGPSVTNDGTLSADYATTLQNINLMGAGSATVSASLKISTATVQQAAVRLSGAGTFSGSSTQIISIGAVRGKPTVEGSIGAYRFTCAEECDDIRTVGTPTSDFSFRING